MPPLATLIISLTVLFLCARVVAAAHFNSLELKQLPFIVDITHGICPQCGDTHTRKNILKEDHDLFWHAFKCRCGYSISIHVR